MLLESRYVYREITPVVFNESYTEILNESAADSIKKAFNYLISKAKEMWTKLRDYFAKSNKLGKKGNKKLEQEVELPLVRDIAIKSLSKELDVIFKLLEDLLKEINNLTGKTITVDFNINLDSDKFDETIANLNAFKNREAHVQMVKITDQNGMTKHKKTVSALADDFEKDVKKKELRLRDLIKDLEHAEKELNKVMKEDHKMRILSRNLQPFLTYTNKSFAAIHIAVHGLTSAVLQMKIRAMMYL